VGANKAERWQNRRVLWTTKAVDRTSERGSYSGIPERPNSGGEGNCAVPKRGGGNQVTRLGLLQDCDERKEINREKEVAGIFGIALPRNWVIGKLRVEGRATPSTGNKPMLPGHVSERR